MDPREPQRDKAETGDDTASVSLYEAEITADMPDTRRVSDLTNIHDAGSDANDTEDGLTESEEAVRQAAEDIPTGADPAGRRDSVPVFDRGSLPPKV
ncbi:hypothetical protein [Bosea sp. (in: a-proteobacteria)]|uniref:hypothetical protein n=1 Tax=Bosea sp. (in: a-proteobacteria) TaxID=1871050 RepID=UPI003B3A7D17